MCRYVWGCMCGIYSTSLKVAQCLRSNEIDPQQIFVDGRRGRKKGRRKEKKKVHDLFPIYKILTFMFLNELDVT